MAYRKTTLTIPDFGVFPLQVTVGLDKATTTADTGFNMVHAEGHAATQISMKRWCKSCNNGQGAEVPESEIKKGRKVGDGFVVVNTDEINDLKAEMVEQYKHVVNLSVHETEAVRALPLGSAYAATPAEASQNMAYTILHDIVSRHPELTFMGLWTPSSRVSLYRLVAYGESLVWEQQARVEEIKVTEVPLLEMTPARQSKIDDALAGIAIPFDPATYADTYAVKVQELLDSKTVEDGVFTERTRGARKPATSGPGVDLFAALDAATVASKAPAKRARKSA